MSEKVSFDRAIYMAVKELKKQYLSTLPSDSRLARQYNPTSAHTQQIEATIHSREKKENRLIWIKRARNIAAAVLIALFLLSFHPTVATAMKNIISQTFIQWFDKYISVETKADEYPQQIKDFTVGYMTDGFVLTETSPYGAGIYKLYENEENNSLISIIVKPDNGTDITGLDNEHSDVSDIFINGDKGIKLSSDDGYSLLLISSNGVQYTIEGFVEFDEISKIYKNIKISL